MSQWPPSPVLEQAIKISVLATVIVAILVFAALHRSPMGEPSFAQVALRWWRSDGRIRSLTKSFLGSILAVALFLGIGLATIIPGFAIAYVFQLGIAGTMTLGMLTHLILCQWVFYPGYPVSPPPFI